MSTEAYHDLHIKLSEITKSIFDFTTTKTLIKQNGEEIATGLLELLELLKSHLPLDNFSNKIINQFITNITANALPAWINATLVEILKLTNTNTIEMTSDDPTILIRKHHEP